MFILFTFFISAVFNVLTVSSFLHSIYIGIKDSSKFSDGSMDSFLLFSSFHQPYFVFNPCIDGIDSYYKRYMKMCLDLRNHSNCHHHCSGYHQSSWVLWMADDVTSEFLLLILNLSILSSLFSLSLISLNTLHSSSLR